MRGYPNRVRVAVVDTGIDSSHPALAPVVDGISIKELSDGSTHIDTDYRDRSGHGTAIASVLSRRANGRLEFLAIRVLDGSIASSVRAISASVRWAVSQRARVINLSLGVEAWQKENCEELHRACREAVEIGCIIVAAAGPAGKVTIPASFEEVITVGTAVCPSDTYYAVDEDQIEFRARGDEQRVAWTAGHEVLLGGSSLAAAHLARVVSEILWKRPEADLQQIRSLLRQRAAHRDKDHRRTLCKEIERFYLSRTAECVRSIRRAVVYPFNKEIHALIRFRDLLPFELVGVIDILGKRLLGQDAGEVIASGHSGLAIGSDLFKALSKADTLILGHLGSLTRVEGRNRVRELVERALDMDKNIFSLAGFESMRCEDICTIAEQRGLLVRDPNVSSGMIRSVLKAVESISQNDCDSISSDGRSGTIDPNILKLASSTTVPAEDCPVLGIFGTSKQQGKFTLQIALRHELSRIGYRIAQLATEPTGMLLGADVTLPMGHGVPNLHFLHSDLNIWAHLGKILLVELKNRIKPDLVLVGGQSGVAPFDKTMLRTEVSPLTTLAFGMAAAPDACVLVANLFDPPEHVWRCLRTIESLFHSPVIAIAFTNRVWQERTWLGVNRRQLISIGDREFSVKLENWSQELKRPCCGILALNGVPKLARLIIEFFASQGPQKPEVTSPALSVEALGSSVSLS